MKTNTWDVADHLTTDEEAAAYLNAVIELDDPALLQEALGDVARARGMGNVAEATHLSRESLYRSLSATGNPYFQTMFKVFKGLNLDISFSPSSESSRSLSRATSTR